MSIYDVFIQKGPRLNLLSELWLTCKVRCAEIFFCTVSTLKTDELKLAFPLELTSDFTAELMVATTLKRNICATNGLNVDNLVP